MKLLRKMPTCIFVQFPGCTWPVHSALAPGVYPLKPMQRTWIVNKEHGSKISRLGSPLLPHFACTCHMVQGLTLKAMLLNSLNFRASVNVEAMLQAYVGLSRVKLASHLLLLQAFSPQLFRQGAPPGPLLLMQVLRREKTLAEAQQEHARRVQEQKAHTKNTRAAGDTYRCGVCCKTLPAKHWNLKHTAHECPRPLLDGHWRRCLSCPKSKAEYLTCKDCGQQKPRAQFADKSSSSITAPDAVYRHCLACRHASDEAHTTRVQDYRSRKNVDITNIDHFVWG